MNDFPDTRDSLLLQVRNPDNRVAWEQFVGIYRPAIVRIALAKGLQHADAQDLAQQVLAAVACAVSKWERRDSSMRFRHWLSRVTRNAILNALMRRPRDEAEGGGAFEDLLRDVSETNGETTSLIKLEVHKELYRRAARIVSTEFRADSWRAFELSVVGDATVEEVAQKLGKSVGAVYTARSRIMFRLREVIMELGELDQ